MSHRVLPPERDGYDLYNTASNRKSGPGKTITKMQSSVGQRIKSMTMLDNSNTETKLINPKNGAFLDHRNAESLELIQTGGNSVDSSFADHNAAMKRTGGATINVKPSYGTSPGRAANHGSFQKNADAEANR